MFWQTLLQTNGSFRKVLVIRIYELHWHLFIDARITLLKSIRESHRNRLEMRWELSHVGLDEIN